MGEPSGVRGPVVAGYAIGTGLGYIWVGAIASVGLLSVLSAQSFNRALRTHAHTQLPPP